MSDELEPLILDLLEWMGPGPCLYLEVLEAWRTSCPRLPVWEEADSRGFLERHHAPGSGQLVSVTEAGMKHLQAARVHSA
jgi:D-3-phosphoglycerate dehydrogenase / 2-oxoglutarate reductase